MNVEKAELRVLKSELETIKPNARVYRQQRNSDVFFLTNKDKELAKVDNELDNLEKRSKTMESMRN